jgi:hypothetical protein
MLISNKCKKLVNLSGKIKLDIDLKKLRKNRKANSILKLSGMIKDKKNASENSDALLYGEK